MHLDTFPYFSSLPLEIRYQICALATPPRLVVVKDTAHSLTPAEDHRRQRLLTPSGRPLAEPSLDRTYLFSRTPFPALLHTCHETRQALIGFGYELAFGTKDAAPLTWFNFQTDIWYLTEHPPFLRSGEASLETILPRDKMRIRRLAFAERVGLNRATFSDWWGSVAGSPKLYYIISQFTHLREFLLVETHVERIFEQRGDDLWGYVECEDIDVKRRVWERGVELSGAYGQLIKQHAAENGGDRLGYFRYHEKELEDWLVRISELASFSNQPPPYSSPSRPTLRQPFHPFHPLESIPKIKIVAVMSRAEANKLLASREMYWYQQARLRLWEEEVGVIENQVDDEWDVINELEDAQEDEFDY